VQGIGARSPCLTDSSHRVPFSRGLTASGPLRRGAAERLSFRLVRLTRFQLFNFKSYRYPNLIEFAPGFNVIVGQNNSGKSALLETLGANFQHNPNRSPGSKPRPTVTIPSQSKCVFDVEITKSELTDLLLTHNQFHLPLRGGENDPVQALFALISLPSPEFHAEFTPGTAVVTRGDPAITDWPPGDQSGLLGPKEDKSGFVSRGISAREAWDRTQHIASCVGQYHQRVCYLFRAERFSPGESAFGPAEALRSDASNLPEVLFALQGSRKTAFERFVALVREVLPLVAHVSVRAKQGGGNALELLVWPLGVDLDRDDLAMRLADCGTGVGQVLAILYVVVTSRDPRTIIIDEPNSFLHPGASRKLIEVLKGFSQHQFIIATHAPEVIRAADPEAVFRVEWEGGESRINRIDPADIDSQRAILLDVGASLGDIFGADRVVWVEGATEEACFPIIIRKLLQRQLLGTAIVAVRDTGAFERRRASAREIWGVYERLSHAKALMPPALAFSFDREGRSVEEMTRLTLESKGRVQFLPRRMYENYLLHPDAIAAILNSLPTFSGAAISVDRVEEWIRDNHQQYLKPDRGSLPPATQDWFREVHGADLLKELFSALSNAKEEFRKVSHTVWLTEWLVTNRPDALKELSDYLKSLLDR